MNLTRRRWLTTAAAATGGAAATAGSAAMTAAQTRARPNIVFILADDLGCFDLGCYGQKFIRTPRIDRLAEEGRRFTRAYAGAAVCAPSRCALMTGLHSGHGSVRANHSSRGQRVPLKPTDYTVARMLKEAGYRTGIFGKWGLGEPETAGVPTRQGFDEWFGYLNQDHATEYWTDYLWRGERKETLKGNLNGARGEYTHDLFTREALRFVNENRQRPFFLYLAYTVPHAELVVPSVEPYSSENWPAATKTYAAMITRMDRDVGRLMDSLKQSGVDGNTLVFFASDNGATYPDAIERFHSTGDLRGKKGEVYEGGIRTPMIARWPSRIPPGTTSDCPWAFWDFLPTVAEIAGLGAPAGLDGVSVAGALTGAKPDVGERPMYWEEHRKGFHQALRLGRWKAVRHNRKPPVELYDLVADECESRDVAAGNPAVVRRLTGLLDSARTPNEDYEIKLPKG